MRFPHATFYARVMTDNIMRDLAPFRIETLERLRRISKTIKDKPNDQRPAAHIRLA